MDEADEKHVAEIVHRYVAEMVQSQQLLLATMLEDHRRIVLRCLERQAMQLNVLSDRLARLAERPTGPPTGHLRY